MNPVNNRRGQAVTELAIFGSIILLMFGALLSYMQRFNDQQYVQMETFRRAIRAACTYRADGGGAGASVQYTLVNDRKHVDLSGNLGRGNTATLSASNNVYWAVPRSAEGVSSESLIAFKVNEDELVRNYRDFVPKDHDGLDDSGQENGEVEWAFSTEEMTTSSDSDYSETSRVEENAQGISNTRTSVLKETKKTKIPYKITIKDDDDDDENDVEVKSGAFWEGDDYPDGQLTQRFYHDDIDGQYKYSSTRPEGTDVERTRTWETPD